MSEGRRHRAQLAAGTALVVVLALAVTSLGLVGAAGGSSSTCGFCHSAQVKSQALSVHASVNCQFCHQRPGLQGIAEQRVAMLRMVRSTFGRPPAQRAAVRDDMCLACHSSVADGVVENAGLRMRHSDLIDQGRACADCHNTVTHGEAIRVFRVATMDDCMQCHVAAPGSDDCNVCHVPGARRQQREYGTPWRITHGATWRYTHGLGQLSTCNTCHPRGYCSRCHGVDLPHPASWANTHGKGARANPESCGPCHSSDLCGGCHSTDMPHEEGFLAQHSSEATTHGKDECMNCHLEASCDACHTAHIHPGLTPAQIERLRPVTRR
jgi:hypothetical protein